MHSSPNPSAPLPGTNSFNSWGVLGGETSYRIARLNGLAGDHLPYTIRILLENLLRNEDGIRVTRDQIEAVLGWGSAASFGTAIELTPGRAFLHDTNGVPVLVDIAAMRDALTAIGGRPDLINPVIPSELVIDHSVIADEFGSASAFERNADIEYERNAERYRFLRWGQSALQRFKVVPPGAGIMHQVNAEYLARVVTAENEWAYPDFCLGTDSHTTMVNGIGVLAWGVGGIEAEAVMLGETYGMLLPPVVGFRMVGTLPEGSTATDLVLTITQQLRAHGVVGKFVEFHGEGVRGISAPDRLTIANMSPEFGSTCAYFPLDDETLRYLAATGRSEKHIALVEAYAKEQGLWHRPEREVHYSEEVEIDLSTVRPSLAGPRRPQDRVPLDKAQSMFRESLESVRLARPALLPGPTAVPVLLGTTPHELDDGTVAIAAITSCTNTSNPSVMIAAGLLARNAVLAGLGSKPWVKTTLSPGSKVVTDYLSKAGLTPYLEQLGFYLAGYGCMTCIGASGPLITAVQNAVRAHGLSVVSVLSGNRNFEGRINGDVSMNYLASPPLVVAYALAGTMDIDLLTQPLGRGTNGADVYLHDVWPSSLDVASVIEQAIDPQMFLDAYANIFQGDARWAELVPPTGPQFPWHAESTYLRRPPYFSGMTMTPDEVSDISGARVLVLLGDSITTDHISPAGAIPAGSCAGKYLTDLGVNRFQLNTYASRRGNHEVMTRGTFANVNLRNQLVPGTMGGYTLSFAENGVKRSIFDAAMSYKAAETPLVVVGGALYGSGSSRDWAAKGPALLGVRVVIARSYERIHRSNLVNMGVLPLEFLSGEDASTLKLTGHETICIRGLAGLAADQSRATVTVHADDITFTAIVRLDTRRERELYLHGGILKFVLRRLKREASVTR